MKRSSYRDPDYAFGQVMLTLRTAIGLTQVGLAEYLGVSRRALGDWEAGNSYPKVAHLKKFIALAVKHQVFTAGSETDEIRALWKAAHQKVLLDENWVASLLTPQTQNAASQPVENRKRGNSGHNAAINLPFQPTPFLGREAELAEIARILGDSVCHLLTLLGPGGVGKTRLALEVAARQADAYTDGAAFVSLASVGTPNQIVSAIGDALNLSFAGQSSPASYLLGYLRERNLLLVLDNFEHLLQGADLVRAIVEYAPHITVLVTSRERLNLRAEWLFDVEGLSYPPSDSRGSAALPNLTELTDYSAIQLFVQRATQVYAGFRLNESTPATVVRICQHVAGMPLAIELAAAGIRTQSVDEIEQQIRLNLDTLSTTLRDVPARHRSMRAVFDQSWNLLSDPERALLTRLGVFRGGCTVDAAERVSGATLSSLTTLVDKSLLREVTEPNTPLERRFFLLEPVREYALEKLSARNGVKTQQRAHARYYLALADAASAQWDTPTVDAAIEQLEREHDNLRAALQWAHDGGDLTIGLQIAGALWRFWRGSGAINEGRAWLEELLALEDSSPDPAAITARLRAMHGAAWLASDQHDFERAEQLFEASATLRRALDQAEDETNLLLNGARQARAAGEYRRATTLLQEALTRQRAQGNRGSSGSAGLGLSLYEMALVLREQGELDRAEALYRECMEFHRMIGDHEGTMSALLGLGDVARDRGDAAGVRQYSEESLAFFRDLGIQWAVGFALNNLALAAYLEGDLPQALTVVSESLSLFRSLKDDGGVAEVLLTVGHIRRAQGDAAAARDAFTEALRLAKVVGPRYMVAAALEGLAGVMAQQGDAAQVVWYVSAASSLRVEMGTPVRPADLPALERALATARSILGDDSFQVVWIQAEEQPLERVLNPLLDA